MISGLFAAINRNRLFVWFGRRACIDVLITALVIARANTVGYDLVVSVHRRIAGVPHAGSRIVCDAGVVELICGLRSAAFAYRPARIRTAVWRRRSDAAG